MADLLYLRHLTVNHAIVIERDDEDEDDTWIAEGRHRLTAIFETGTRYTVTVRTDFIASETDTSEHLGTE
ncbi:hypothetical protein AB0395_33895 [Streptosporangium sp. NPDC051023]|uniref:hypothetical protein n=1 Tax=Streptosporangium sp. NPDC051023 TaxID=3155410 RepID=UPI00344D17DC